MKKILPALIMVFGVAISLYHFYTAGYGMMTAMKHRILHLGVMMALGMLMCLRASRMETVKDKIYAVLDVLAAAAALLSVVYLLGNYEQIINRAGRFNTVDRYVGISLLVALLWATLRTVGVPMVAVALAALAYAFLGRYLPGGFGHKGFSLNRILSILTWSGDGILATPLGASATFIIIFLILASIMEQTGSGRFFINIALAVTGRTRGGPAKAAVVASGLFGSISGSAVANVVSTGTFTIPLMKRAGFNHTFAAAVEAVVSTGGQLMPPVMGAGAFIMAEMTGTPYLIIVKAALIPAILYYLATYFVIDLNSRRKNLVGMPADDLPSLKKEMLENGHLLLPIVILLALLISGRTALMAGFYTIIATVLIGMIRKSSRIGVPGLCEALRNAATGCTTVACATACAGIIMGVMSLTGLGMKFSSIIIQYSNNQILPALFLTMCASLVLGMGLPTAAAYIILAVMVAPALINMGASKLSAHLFVFYFGIISAITPPVALAAYAAAGLAKTDPMKTGFVAFKLGITAFIVPYMFVFGAPLMLEGTVTEIVTAIVSSVIGVYLVAAALEGWLWNERLLLPFRFLIFAAALLTLQVGLVTDFLGYGLALAVYFSNRVLLRSGSSV